MSSYYVYILTNANRQVMYVGVTNNLENRVAEHRDGKGGIEDAIAREKGTQGLAAVEERRTCGRAESKLDRFARDRHCQRSLASLGMTRDL
jgi:predicted GIY-YIG superfamily endonuclease